MDYSTDLSRAAPLGARRISVTGRIGLILGAFTAVALLVAAYLLFVTSYNGQFMDNETMTTLGSHLGSDVPTSGWLGQHQIAVLAGGGLLIATICALRRSPRLAVHAVVLIGGAVVAALLLKAGLDRPSFGIGTLTNSFPSNTVAAFVALALALSAVSPSAVRTAVTVVAVAGAGAVSAWVVLLQWHRPSDVIGGWLIAVAAAFIAESLAPARNAA
ncbi:phosphatase PAP2 family protein [Gordonia zhaorongruii]|uniref:phosphatase PAP2 family protein n=1 Tax=Gordonia zhaorongruii TaxID=2597659 RepID=UPI0010521C9B|nr:phosphatase PAP2 family protein [Gordonia zhaorongruii]